MESQSSIADSETELQSCMNGELVDFTDPDLFFEDLDSASSTPYVSAHSSPGRGGPVSGFFYSAPASPMHFAITKNPTSSPSSIDNHSFSFEFDFSSRFGSNGGLSSTASMCSADELFHNGKIRPMKLPLAPLMDEEGDGIVELVRGRDLRVRDKLQRRRTRSMSPLRTENGVGIINVECSVIEKVEATTSGSNCEATTPSISASPSAGRSSKRWVFLKDFLYRSKSEGRSNSNFWSNISFAPLKDKKNPNPLMGVGGRSSEGKKAKKGTVAAAAAAANKAANGVGKRRVPPLSPHERHYTANRAHSEEMKKKTYLPYRQGLLGCLGFTSKGYGAVNGFAKAFNSVSSR